MSTEAFPGTEAFAGTEAAPEVVIVGGARTPQGRLNGQLASFTAVELGAFAIAGALERSGVDASQVDSVIMGHVVQAGCGQNPARQSAIKAGLGWDVPTVTISGKTCKVLGCICSEAVMIDVTGVACEAGDEVLFDINPLMLNDMEVEYI